MFIYIYSSFIFEKIIIVDSSGLFPFLAMRDEICRKVDYILGFKGIEGSVVSPILCLMTGNSSS